MAVVRIPVEQRILRGKQEVSGYLSGIGVDYEQWESSRPLAADAPPEEVLEAYSPEIEELKAREGYVTADVISVNPGTPGLGAMLEKFSREHWHSDDEVRFILHGRGLFHIHPPDGPVAAVEVAGGDLIRVPMGTRHWFDLCSERTIRAIRLFKDPAGWAPHYTGSGIDAKHIPVCLGPDFLPQGTLPI